MSCEDIDLCLEDSKAPLQEPEGEKDPDPGLAAQPDLSLAARPPSVAAAQSAIDGAVREGWLEDTRNKQDDAAAPRHPDLQLWLRLLRLPTWEIGLVLIPLQGQPLVMRLAGLQPGEEVDGSALLRAVGSAIMVSARYRQPALLQRMVDVANGRDYGVALGNSFLEAAQDLHNAVNLDEGVVATWLGEPTLFWHIFRQMLCHSPVQALNGHPQEASYIYRIFLQHVPHANGGGWTPRARLCGYILHLMDLLRRGLLP